MTSSKNSKLDYPQFLKTISKSKRPIKLKILEIEKKDTFMNEHILSVIQWWDTANFQLLNCRLVSSRSHSQNSTSKPQLSLKNASLLGQFVETIALVYARSLFLTLKQFSEHSMIILHLFLNAESSNAQVQLRSLNSFTTLIQMPKQVLVLS